jgi:hypothetical protein
MTMAAGLAVAAALLWVYLRTRSAPRSTRFAWIGLILVGCAVGCFVAAPWLEARPVVERLGWGILAAATGLAHACAFNLVPLPHNRTRLRMILVPLGMWAGGAGSFAILTQHQHPWMDLVALALTLPVATASNSLDEINGMKTLVYCSGEHNRHRDCGHNCCGVQF